MNTKKLLLSLGVPAVLGSTLLTGCGQPNNQAATNSTAPVAEAPENSTAEKGGETGAMKARSDATKLAFSSAPRTLPVGKAATWTIKITDSKSGEAVKDFAVVHDKLMHLIVVSKDLSWFNHIHPTHKGNGVFTVSAKLPHGGAYKLYADYTPQGGGNEVAQHELSLDGISPIGAKLVPDKMQGAWMKKKVTAHVEGEPNAKGGATYEVALMPMPTPLLAGQDTMLHFQVRDAKSQPIKDLQPYLGAMGHCVILSQDTTKYLHSHPMEGGMNAAGGMDHDMSKMGEMKSATPPKSGGPDVMFHTNFPTAGLYKTWGQFMHKGKIITAAFVVNVGAAKAGAANDAAHGESQPHAH